MICTFGDITDVIWWRELAAADARRSSAATAGCCAETPGLARRATGAAAAYAELAGKTAVQRARARSSSCCASPATSTASPRPITHPVKFYEKGDRPLEIVTSRQWYIRNGGRDADLRDALARARPRAARGTRRTCGTATRTGSTASTATG